MLIIETNDLMSAINYVNSINNVDENVLSYCSSSEEIVKLLEERDNSKDVPILIFTDEQIYINNSFDKYLADRTTIIGVNFNQENEPNYHTIWDDEEEETSEDFWD